MVAVYIRAVRDIPQARETNSLHTNCQKTLTLKMQLIINKKAFVIKTMLSPARVYKYHGALKELSIHEWLVKEVPPHTNECDRVKQPYSEATEY